MDSMHMCTNLDYIHNDPVKVRYALDPKDYIYSSAISYEDESKGLLNIDLLRLQTATNEGRFVTRLRSCRLEDYCIEGIAVANRDQRGNPLKDFMIKKIESME